MATLRAKYAAYVAACKAADIPRAEILTWRRWCEEYADCARADMRGVKALPDRNAYDLDRERQQTGYPVRHRWGRVLAKEKKLW